MKFFDDDVLLYTDEAKRLYSSVKDLPILDYHCHLDPSLIAKNERFTDIGRLWLEGDHYKWRAMRIMGVDEEYITGGKSWKEKFCAYASVLPSLIGNALYYWTHFELKQIFGINEPLNSQSAERIYDLANEKLKSLSVYQLFELFKVEVVATTDDPIDSLENHKTYGNTRVIPTFRPDKLYALNDEYVQKLAYVSGKSIQNLDDLLVVLENRLDFFVSRGCKMSDHGFDTFPASYATKEEAESIFANRNNATDIDKDKFFGFLLLWLSSQYAKRGITMQIHFAVTRNVNPQYFAKCGVDSGFDVISTPTDPKRLIDFLSRTTDETRPEIVLYTLNDAPLKSLTAITGAFRKVRMGAAWWFNDTVEGIRTNLKTIAEYSALGSNLGMLTDSRSFSSYSRFDFFRRLLCDYVGNLVSKGEYDEESAYKLVENICYNNPKTLL